MYHKRQMIKAVTVWNLYIPRHIKETWDRSKHCEPLTACPDKNTNKEEGNGTSCPTVDTRASPTVSDVTDSVESVLTKVGATLAHSLLPKLSLHLLSLHLPSSFVRAHSGQAANGTQRLWQFGGRSEWTVLVRDVGCSARPTVGKRGQHRSLLDVFWHTVTCCPSLCLPGIRIRQRSLLPLRVVFGIIMFFFGLGMPSAIILQMKNSKG